MQALFIRPCIPTTHTWALNSYDSLSKADDADQSEISSVHAGHKSHLMIKKVLVSRNIQSHKYGPSSFAQKMHAVVILGCLCR